MRSEEEMLKLIIDTAKEDERIRAAVMNGSRANPNAPKDFFQDFDVVYFVRDILPFKNNHEWIQRFGELMILQEPEEMVDPPAENGGFCSYLMQFMDGNRIDLGIYPVEKFEEHCQDSVSVLLLDKDGMATRFRSADEGSYLPQPPTAKRFADCCNEFWWVCPYVAKGLWRRELPYARFMLDEAVREQLMKMLTWMIGVRTQFQVNPGKFGKYFEKHLKKGEWELLLRTYAAGDYEASWEALESMGKLFRKAAKEVGAHFGYDYPEEEDRKVSQHLKHVRKLPRDAKEMY